jgi:hypothetical protein
MAGIPGYKMTLEEAEREVAAQQSKMVSGSNRDSIIDFERGVDYKIWKYNPDSVAGVIARDTGIEIFGGKKASIFVNDTTGITLKGPTAFTGMPNSIQIGGLWRLNNEMMSTIPSTIMTPVSTMNFYMPGQSMFRALKEVFKFLASAGALVA